MQLRTANVVALIICTSIFILVLAIFVVSLLHKYKKRQQRYEEDLLTARLEMQEQTMQHIAGELHDSVGIKLTRSKLTLATLNYCQPEVAKSNIDGCIEELAEVIQALRNLGQSLSGDYIVANGLVSTLRQEVKRTQKSGTIQASLQIIGDVPVLADAAELLIFRIVQEAIQNVLKHAAAKSVKVMVVYNKPCLTITITDNGRGLKTEKESEAQKEKEAQAATVNKTETEKKKEPPKGMGIINMKRRAALIGGQLQLLPAPGGGTIATFTILHY
jgi:two-component system, NarL family, sensor kinase